MEQIAIAVTIACAGLGFGLWGLRQVALLQRLRLGLQALLAEHYAVRLRQRPEDEEPILLDFDRLAGILERQRESQVQQLSQSAESSKALIHDLTQMMAPHLLSMAEILQDGSVDQGLSPTQRQEIHLRLAELLELLHLQLDQPLLLSEPQPVTAEVRHANPVPQVAAAAGSSHSSRSSQSDRPQNSGASSDPHPATGVGAVVGATKVHHGRRNTGSSSSLKLQPSPPANKSQVSELPGVAQPIASRLLDQLADPAQQTPALLFATEESPSAWNFALQFQTAEIPALLLPTCLQWPNTALPPYLIVIPCSLYPQDIAAAWSRWQDWRDQSPHPKTVPQVFAVVSSTNATERRHRLLIRFWLPLQVWTLPLQEPAQRLFEQLSQLDHQDQFALVGDDQFGQEVESLLTELGMEVLGRELLWESEGEPPVLEGCCALIPSELLHAPPPILPFLMISPSSRIGVALTEFQSPPLNQILDQIPTELLQRFRQHATT